MVAWCLPSRGARTGLGAADALDDSVSALYSTARARGPLTTFQADNGAKGMRKAQTVPTPGVLSKLMAAAVFDDRRAYDRKPLSGTPAHLFGGEKWLEKAIFTSGVIPHPLSPIQISTWSPSQRVRMFSTPCSLCGPSAMACAALTTRLRNAWFSSLGKPSTCGSGSSAVGTSVTTRSSCAAMVSVSRSILFTSMGTADSPPGCEKLFMALTMRETRVTPSMMRSIDFGIWVFAYSMSAASSSSASRPGSSPALSTAWRNSSRERNRPQNLEERLR